MAWYFTGLSVARNPIFFNNVFNTAYQSLYQVETAGGSYDLVAVTTQISSYCGVYECIEDNGGGSTANSTVSGRLMSVSEPKLELEYVAINI